MLVIADDGSLRGVVLEVYLVAWSEADERETQVASPVAKLLAGTLGVGFFLLFFLAGFLDGKAGLCA